MKTIKFLEVKQLHKMLCPDVSLECFMEHYCKSFLDKHHTVEVTVSENFKFTYTK